MHNFNCTISTDLSIYLSIYLSVHPSICPLVLFIVTSECNRGLHGEQSFAFLLSKVQLFLSSKVRFSIQGFMSNGQQVTYKNCDKNANNHFAFFPDHEEKKPLPIHANNLVYETTGVAVKWRNSGRKMPSHRTMPNDFIFLTEVSFGGCGCYTSSDRWREAQGAAIGLR